MKKLHGLLFALLFLFCGSLLFNSLSRPSTALALPSFFTNKTLYAGFDQPVDLVETDDNRIFVLEKNGTIKVFENGEVSATPLMCGSKTNGCPVKINVDVFQERGALGLALDPNFS